MRFPDHLSQRTSNAAAASIIRGRPVVWKGVAGSSHNVPEKNVAHTRTPDRESAHLQARRRWGWGKINQLCTHVSAKYGAKRQDGIRSVQSSTVPQQQLREEHGGDRVPHSYRHLYSRTGCK